MKSLDIITQIAIAEMLANKGALLNAAAELEETAESGKPFMVKTPSGMAFGIKKDSDHPIAQFLRSLEQEVEAQTDAEQDDEPCDCDDCKIREMLMEAADTVVEKGVGASIDSNIPNLEDHLALLLEQRDDIKVGRNGNTGQFIIVPADFAEKHQCTCGECNESTHQEGQSEEQTGAPEENHAQEQSVVAASQSQQAVSPQELVQQAVEREILARYPDAKRADKGLSVGDVIICHPSVPSVLVTPENIMHYGHEKGYFIIAHVGNA